jgi:hypothetical protein
MGPKLQQTALAVRKSQAIGLSDDRLLQILQTLAVLLFVSVGALSLGRAQNAWVKWARRGAVAAFSIAFVYAVVMTIRWALGAGADRW